MATIRPSRRIERAGVNAVRTLLEDHEHIVQEIDGGNDHGEDLFINVTRGGRRTGHYFAVQVKRATTADHLAAIGASRPTVTAAMIEDFHTDIGTHARL
ncbi:DUF4365 domain-containing protein [Kitasatospora sp. NPDC097691]|uniref:DUF4365 domain-containing protein n=1 Tax=Kitasatospora sp. NPDC097691 TaxID=3157231 RepID=UPI003319C955